MEAKHLRSPHLALVLKKRVQAGELSAEASDELYQNFLQSVGAQGASEIGYEREPGSSFNPRAARIALILLEDCGICAPEVIREALLAASQGGAYRQHLEQDAAGAIAGAFLLDRIRHLHLETGQEQELVLERALAVSQGLGSEAPRLALLLEKGVERIERLKIGRSATS